MTDSAHSDERSNTRPHLRVVLAFGIALLFTSAMLQLFFGSSKVMRDGLWAVWPTCLYIGMAIGAWRPASLGFVLVIAMIWSEYYSKLMSASFWHHMAAGITFAAVAVWVTALIAGLAIGYCMRGRW